MNMKRLKKLPEFIRFIMVGVFATALHYGLYFIFQRFINVNIAYSIGYILSFIANFLSDSPFYLRKEAILEESFWLRGSPSDQLYPTYKFTESVPLVRLFQTLRPHTGIYHRYPGKLPASEICFQIQRKIICFSPDFLRILQKE